MKRKINVTICIVLLISSMTLFACHSSSEKEKKDNVIFDSQTTIVDSVSTTDIPTISFSSKEKKELSAIYDNLYNALYDNNVERFSSLTLNNQFVVANYRLTSKEYVYSGIIDTKSSFIRNGKLFLNSEDCTPSEIETNICASRFKENSKPLFMGYTVKKDTIASINWEACDYLAIERNSDSICDEISELSAMTKEIDTWSFYKLSQSKVILTDASNLKKSNRSDDILVFVLHNSDDKCSLIAIISIT